MKITPLKFSLFIVITFSISLILLGQLIYKNTLGILSSWGQSGKVIVYLKTDASAEEKKNLLDLIKNFSVVSKAEFIDRKQAALDFQKSLKELSTGLLTDDEMIDLIPETIEITLSDKLTLSDREKEVTSLNEKLTTYNTVEEISYNATWLKKFEKIDSFVRAFGFILLVFLLIVSSYLVSLMIQIFIDDSKSEIEIFGLLGATSWSIYKIFLKDSFIFLAFSSIFAYAVTYSSFVILKNKFSNAHISNLITDSLHFLNVQDSLLVLLLVYLTVFITCLITVQKSVDRLINLSDD